MIRSQAAEGDSQKRGFANSIRGEAALQIQGEPHVLRPTFAALVAAEEELGPLFALVDRAAEGKLRLSEQVALFWHCLVGREDITRDDVGEAVVSNGLADTAAPLRSLLGQILRGRAG